MDLIMDTTKTKWKREAPMYIELSDKRYNTYSEQLSQNGFSDTETWSLDSVISEFIVPRLIRFKEINNGYPYETTPEKWNEIIDDMIFAFQWNIECEDEKYDALTNEEQRKNWERHKRGLELFSKHFRDLWW